MAQAQTPRKETDMDLADIARKLDDLTRMVRQIGNSQGPEYYTVDQAAEVMKVSPRTLRRRIASGELPVKRIGSSPRIHRSDISPTA